MPGWAGRTPNINIARSIVYGRFNARALSHINQRKSLLPTWNRGVDIAALDKAVQDARSASTQKGIRRPYREPNDAGEWKCCRCAQYKPAAAFRMRSPPSTGLDSYCKECASLRYYGYRCTLRGQRHTLVGAARHRASRVPHRGLECTLTADYVLDMLWDQKGLCYYSGAPMNYLQPNSHWRLSWERLDNKLGYTRHNCVLVAAEFNTSDYSVGTRSLSSSVSGTAQWSKHKVQQLPLLRRSLVDLDLLEKPVQGARGSDRRLSREGNHRGRGRKPNASGEWKCSTCHLYKPAAAFHLTNSGSRPCSLCVDCKRDYNQIYLASLRGSLVNLLSNAVQRSKQRGQPCDLNLDALLNKLLEQHGRCYYSGIPLAFAPHSHWRMSLERLQNSEGYTALNCVWVANEFNTPDYSRNKAKFPVYGTAQWSKAKVEFVWGL